MSTVANYIISMKFETAVEALSALGHPVRLRIVHLLARTDEKGMPVGELALLLDMRASTLSHHLSALVRTGVVEQERLGTTLKCRVSGNTLDALARYLAGVAPDARQ